MSRLKALFNRGFIKLTKGRQLMWVAQDELVMSESEFKKSVSNFANNRVKSMEECIEELEEMGRRAYSAGYKAGLRKSSEYTLVLPSTVPNDKELVDVVSLIANELLEQGDVESCVWLFKEIFKCRIL